MHVLAIKQRTLNFYFQNISKDEPEKIRELYDRAVGKCGREWKSDKIWDSFSKWEQVSNKKMHIFQLGWFENTMNI